MMLAYCDYIASLIRGNLKANDVDKLLSSVSAPQLHLAASGAFLSTRKTINVEDRHGKQYRITIEEV